MNGRGRALLGANTRKNIEYDSAGDLRPSPLSGNEMRAHHAHLVGAKNQAEDGSGEGRERDNDKRARKRCCRKALRFYVNDLRTNE